MPADGAGFVTRFLVTKHHLDRYKVHEAGGSAHLEYWIPADELDGFNEAIVGQIEVVQVFQWSEEAPSLKVPALDANKA